MHFWSWKIDENNIVRLDFAFWGRLKVSLNGQVLSHISGWKRKSETQFSLNDGRQVCIIMSTWGFGREYKLYVDKILYLSEKEKIKQVKCEKCGNMGTFAVQKCAVCGHPYPDAEHFLHTTHVKEATQSIAIISGMFLLFGIVMFFVEDHYAKTTLLQLQGHEDSEKLNRILPGNISTVGELRAFLSTDARNILIINVLLAVIMAGLAWWSKKASLLAILVATAVYAVVIVTNAIMNPMTISQGLFVKVVMIGLLVRGIKAALEMRAREKAL